MMDDKKVKKVEDDKSGKKDEVVHLKQEITELEDRVKRIFADYQNLEKRVAEERRTLILNSNKHLLLRLIPVLDTLMFALVHTKDKGLELAIQQFMDALAAEGVKKIETKDKIFDPAIMECVAVEPGEDCKVISEVLAGYLLSDKVLRPAKVKVGKKNIEKDKLKN
jgi:molecular chaperone GrpE (heat shock protein)